MAGILETGERLKTTSGTAVIVQRQLSPGGAQGEIYEADLEGTRVALKWYVSSAATPAQRENLTSLVGFPAPSDRFLWPLAIVESDSRHEFGYVMKLAEPRFKDLSAFMTREADLTFSCATTAAFILSDAFLALHSKGLCYRDISLGNALVDPANGDVLIADNDNVAIDDASVISGVLGTPSFMAPEVVRGETRPSTETDLYSMAVLLFHLLLLSHPLEGARESAIHCINAAARLRLHGYDPLFIFDPVDASNRPDPQYHPNALIYWDIYPEAIKDLFLRSFCEGLSDGAARVRESEWRKAMVALRDTIINCDHCGAENFAEDGPRPSRPCWHCKVLLPVVPRLLVQDFWIPIRPGKRLYPHHVNPATMYDFAAPVAEITVHPADRSILGLRNLSGTPWTTSSSGGVVVAVEPGKSCSLSEAQTIQFGTSEGHVKF
jgi:eukaryotic-like serine/threonine-protein kinase